MKLKAKNEIVKPAVDAVQYPDMWLKTMSIDAQNPNGKVSIRGTLIPSRDVTVDGVTKKELYQRDSVQLNIPDVFEVIAANPTGKVAIAYKAILEALVEQLADDIEAGV